MRVLSVDDGRMIAAGSHIASGPDIVTCSSDKNIQENKDYIVITNTVRYRYDTNNMTAAKYKMELTNRMLRETLVGNFFGWHWASHSSQLHCGVKVRKATC